MDEIRIRELEIYAYHGVYPEENRQGQRFFVNATLFTDTRTAGLTDELQESTDYGAVCRLIHEVVTGSTRKLIETVAEETAQAILLQFPLVKKLFLELRKPEAPVGLPFGSVSVAVERGWHKVYLSLGSNMGDRQKHLKAAIESLEAHPLIRLGKISSLTVTSPYGGVEQEDFLNGALELDTLLLPGELLEYLHSVEAGQGRERTLRWGPRTLDLDILLYDDLVSASEELILPHVDMQNRLFVLEPMTEIAPWVRHPVLQKTMQELLQELKK